MRMLRLSLLVALAGVWGGETLAQEYDRVITRVSPQRFSQGSTGSVLQLFGLNLNSGLLIEPLKLPEQLHGVIQFTPVRTLSSTLAVTTVTVRRDAPPNRYSFQVLAEVYKGQYAPIGYFNLNVTAGSSLVAPVTVTTVAIVHPLEGALVAEGERLFPRAVLATTGSGSITGFWELDGVPFERFVANARGGYPVTVSARTPVPRSSIGAHYLVARADSPQAFESEPVRVVFVHPRPTLLRLVSPLPEGASAPDESGGGPVLRWTAQPGTLGYEVLLSRTPNETVTTRTFRTLETTWRLPEKARSRLGVGRVWWTVRPVFPGEVEGRPAEWRPLELVATAAEVPSDSAWEEAALEGGPDAFGPSGGGGLRMAAGAGQEEAGQSELPIFDWRLDLGGSVTSSTAKDLDESHEARLPATLSLFYEGQKSAASASVDLSFLREISPGDRGFQESRAYVVGGRTYNGPWGLLGTVGYFVPTAVTGSSLLSAGLVRGGAEAGVETPAGTLRYYGSYDNRPAGTASAVLSGEQEVRVASWGLPLPARVGALQLVAMDVTDDGDEVLGLAQADARSYGILGSFLLSDAWQLELEGAQSTVEEEHALEREGNAYRLAVLGDLAGTSLVLTLQRTDDTFTNPASGSLAPGGIPDRTSADLSLSRLFGETATGLTVRWETSGEAEEGLVPAAQQHALDAFVDAPLSAITRLAVSGSYSHGRSDATVYEPEVTVANWVATAGLTALWDAFSLTPSVTWQSTRNSGYEDAEVLDVDLISAAVSVGGALGERMTLAGSASWTRNAPGLGETITSTLVSVQPTWILPRGFSVGPVLAASWDDIPLAGEQRTYNAQLTASWYPPSESRFPLGVSVAGGWRETSYPAFAPESACTESDWNASLSLILRWGQGSPAPAASAARLTLPRTVVARGPRLGWVRGRHWPSR